MREFENKHFLAMSSEKTNNSQEIDLSLVYRKISSFFAGVELSIYRLIRFVIKNSFIILGLVIIGVVAGYFLDNQKNKIYKHEIIVIPNFESSTYLYKTIENLSLDSEESFITNVTITPITSVYQFVTTNNLEIAKYLSENNIELSKHKPGNETEIIHKYHLITIYTNKPDTDGAIVSNFLDLLNQEKHFDEKQKISLLNTETKLAENQKSIEDINAIFKKLGDPTEQPKGAEINVEVHSQINDLLEGKIDLVNNSNWLKTKQLEESKVIYEAARFSNIKSKSKLYKIVVPLFFVFLFLMFGYVKNIYKKYHSSQI